MLERRAFACCLAAFAAVLLLAPAASAAPVAEGHSGWLWGNPQPQGQTLDELEFVGDRGYAGGEFGTLVRTDDGGATWTGLRTGLTEKLRQVDVVNANTLVIAGACALRRSDDGGQSFSRLPWTASDADCPSTIAAIHFPNPNTGYVVTQDSSVFRTDDGGETFARVTSVPGSGAPSDVFFTSPDTGVATTAATGSGKIYRTTDGGNSWTEVEDVGQGLNAVTFVGGGPIGYAVGDGKSMLGTDNGGQTWSPRALAGPAETPKLVGIDCADPLTCLIAVNDGRSVLRTTDGGLTATAVTPSSEAIFAVAFASLTRAVGVGGAGATVVSDDSGMTWSPIGERFLGTGFVRLRATNAEIAHMAGPDGTIARTLDGGQNWFTVGVPTTVSVIDASFPAQNVGYALDANGGAFRTANGGASWSILNTGASQSPGALLALDSNRVLLIGPTGVRLSTDGGGQFAAVEDRDVSAAGLSDGDLAGETVLVFGTRALRASADGGQSWSKVRLPARKTKIQDADFVDRSSGYLLTTDGRVFRTTNGGRKWRESVSVGTGRGFDLSFSSADSGYLSLDLEGPTSLYGGGGVVLRTTNGGGSWQPQLMSQTQVLAVDAGATGYAGTGVGHLFATYTGGQAATPSALTLKKAGGKSLSAARQAELKKKGKVKVTGTLSPPEGGEAIVVATRSRKGGWSQRVVTAASNGEFTVTLKPKGKTTVVAQWIGDDTRDGAGSAAIKVKPPKKKKGKKKK
jgi:photosystem II stability/assembly factor-like uncharacterized protein